MSVSFRQILKQTFGEYPLTILEIRGVVSFIALEVGRALGYSEDGANFVVSVGQWAKNGEIRQGEHLIRVEGEDLAEVKALTSETDVSRRAPSLLLLTERGLYRSLILSGGPKAATFRDWLDGVVLPSIRATGGYAVTGTVGAETAGVGAREALRLSDEELRGRVRVLPAELRRLPRPFQEELVLAEHRLGFPLTGVRFQLAQGPVPRLLEGSALEPDPTAALAAVESLVKGLPPELRSAMATRVLELLRLEVLAGKAVPAVRQEVREAWEIPTEAQIRRLRKAPMVQLLNRVKQVWAYHWNNGYGGPGDEQEEPEPAEARAARLARVEKEREVVRQQEEAHRKAVWAEEDRLKRARRRRDDLLRRKKGNVHDETGGWTDVPALPALSVVARAQWVALREAAFSNAHLKSGDVPHALRKELTEAGYLRVENNVQSLFFFLTVPDPAAEHPGPTPAVGGSG